MAAATSTRWTIGFLLLPLLLVAGFGLLVLWNAWSVLNSFGLLGDEAVAYDTPNQLASVSVPVQPNSLAWSADGRYLAAGTWGSTTNEPRPYEVYVVDVAKASLRTTLTPKGQASGLAFSPDGKWLAVATRPFIPAGEVPSELSELVVFDVPAFTARFTAKSGRPESGFIELAWAPDSKSLHAIDGPVNSGTGKAEVRRWDVPAFTEQPVVRALQLQGDAALAVSPDGRTVALSYGEGEVKKSKVVLLDLGEGAEQSFWSGDPLRNPRLGFTADGKAVGKFDTNRMSWWDVATGRPVKPGETRFAVQPAGLSAFRSRAALSPDGRWQAWGYEQHPGLGHLSFREDEPKYGGFINVTHSATGKTQTWRVSRAQYPPAVAFSPDGTRLAGTVTQPSGGAILIWAVSE